MAGGHIPLTEVAWRSDTLVLRVRHTAPTTTMVSVRVLGYEIINYLYDK